MGSGTWIRILGLELGIWALDVGLDLDSELETWMPSLEFAPDLQLGMLHFDMGFCISQLGLET